MEVQEERSSTVSKTFRKNLGALSTDLMNIGYRKLYTIWLVLMARLNPMSLLNNDRDVFIEWDDDAWLDVLEKVVEARRAKGVPSRAPV